MQLPGRRFLLFLFLAVTSWFAGVSSAAAGETPATRLRAAWDEYGFQAWSNTRRIFAGVAASAAASAAEKHQARFGLALVTQYQLPGYDPAAARGMYEALLRDVPAGEALRAAILGQIGSCLFEQTPADYDQGRVFLRKALAEQTADAFITQEISVRLLASYLQRPSLKEFKAGLAVADELLPKMPRGTLTSVAHGLAAQLAFAVGDLKRFEAELVAQEGAGVENREIRQQVLFRIARLNETVLRDYGKAADYYQKLHDEIPTSTQAYWAGLRAAELRQGKLNSAYAPPLVKDEGREAGAAGDAKAAGGAP
jgi:hypothetical protein